MQFIQGQPRHQTYFATLGDQVGPDNPVRLIDAFIDKLDLAVIDYYKPKNDVCNLCILDEPRNFCIAKKGEPRGNH